MRLRQTRLRDAQDRQSGKPEQTEWRKRIPVGFLAIRHLFRYRDHYALVDHQSELGYTQSRATHRHALERRHHSIRGHVHSTLASADKVRVALPQQHSTMAT